MPNLEKVNNLEHSEPETRTAPDASLGDESSEAQDVTSIECPPEDKNCGTVP